MTDYRSKLFRHGDRWCSKAQLDRLRREAAEDGPEAEERLKRAEERCGIRKKHPKAITIRGRRWFDTSYGNTYHTARIVVDWENKRDVLMVPFAYGGERQYEDSAYDALIEAGILPPKRRFKSGGTDVIWRYAADHNIKYDAQAKNVKRKKDLHLGGKRK